MNPRCGRLIILIHLISLILLAGRPCAAAKATVTDDEVPQSAESVVDDSLGLGPVAAAADSVEKKDAAAGDGAGGGPGDGVKSKSKPQFVASNDPGSPKALSLTQSDSTKLDADATMSVKMQYIVIALVCAIVAVVGVVVAIVCYCRFRRSESATFAGQGQGNGYATYGVTGPVSKNSFHFHEPGDRKLAQSAQMYHYQYQKQQMIDMEKANGEVKTDNTDEENEAEDEDDVVYQTCGLASSADLQIPNPVFKGEEGERAAPDGDHDAKDKPDHELSGRQGD